jgi:hypothetical protein
MSINQRAKRLLLPDPGPRRVPLGLARGIRMQIDFASQTRTYLGLYEIELSRFLRSVLAPGLRTFDVGVQHGYDSLLVAKHTHAAVAAFEGDPACLPGMRRNFALNPELAELIQPIQAMVGDQTGQTGLDDWAYGDGFIPDFIKLDIDGGELGALRSATRLLRERRPALLVEVHSLELERECGRLLVDHGYRPVIVHQRRLLPDRRPIGHNRWLVAGG